MHNGCSSEKVRLSIIQKLFAKGVNPDKTGIYGCTPLHCACYTRLYNVAIFLSEKRCDLHKKNIKGAAPIDFIKEGPLNRGGCSKECRDKLLAIANATETPYN